MTTPSLSPTSTLIPMSPTLFVSFVLTPPQKRSTPTTPSTSSLPPSLRLSFTTTHLPPLFAIVNTLIVVSNCTAGQGVPLIHANVDFTLESVNYFDDPSSPSSPLLEQLVPDPELEEGMEHPTIFQLTVFKCGGFTLGVAMHHSICDGLGGNQFFNAMAELARGSTQISVEPIWDRERLLGPRNPPRVDSPLIREFLYLDKGFSPDKGGIVRECFHVSDDSLDKFKRSLFHQSGFNFTTFEALSAYIWRSK